MSDLQAPEVLNLVKRLFGRDHSSQPERDSEVSSRHQARPRRSEGVASEDRFLSNHEKFETRLQHFLSRNNADTELVSGRVHLLNTDEIRDRLGERWEKLASQVHHTITDTLKNRLSRNDFFMQYDDDTYLILFENASEQEAKLKCALLANEIKTKLFGEDASELAEALNVQTVIAQVDGTLATERLSSAQALDEAITQAQKSADAAPAEHDGPGSPDAGGMLTPEEVAELLGVAEERLEAFERGPKTQTRLDAAQDQMGELIRQLRNFEKALTAVDTAPSGDEAKRSNAQTGSDWKSQYFSALNVIHKLTERAENQLARQQADAPAAFEPEQKEDLCLEATFSYTPVWHVAKKAVGAHVCQMSLQLNEETLPYVEILRKDLSSDLTTIIDRILIRKASQDLKEAAAAGQVRIAGIPIHFSTLDGLGSQREFQYLCHAIPRDLYNLLIWEIVNAPLDAWRSHLPLAVSAAKPFGRAIFLRADLFRASLSDVVRDLRSLRNAGVHAVGLDMTAISTPQSDVIALLERFAAAANRYGLKCYALGLDSMSLVTAAVCAGFDHVSGSPVAEPTESPGGITPKTAEEIYLRRFAKVS